MARFLVRSKTKQACTPLRRGLRLCRAWSRSTGWPQRWLAAPARVDRVHVRVMSQAKLLDEFVTSPEARMYEPVAHAAT